MIPTTVSRSGIAWNDLLEAILKAKSNTLWARMGRLDPIGGLHVLMWWDGNSCRCQLSLRIPGRSLNASAEHVAPDVALDRAFDLFIRRIERESGVAPRVDAA